MNELQVIEILRKAFNAEPKRGRGFFDDVAVIEAQEGSIAVKADMFVAGTDMPPGMTLRQAARKAVVACLSDMAVKGVDAKYFMISFGIPRRLANKNAVLPMVEGLKQISKEYGLSMLGGDVNESKDLVIDCLMIGRVGKSPERRGAKAGDEVYAIGAFGYTGLGLQSLLTGLRLPQSIREKCLEQVYEPRPDFECIRKVVSSGLVNSSMDSSDGLAMTLYEIAEQSGVSIYVDSLPTDEMLINSGIERQVLHKAVFYGGEEYSAVITVPSSRRKELQYLTNECRAKLYRVGRVEKGRGVFFTTERGGERLSRRGWVHLNLR